MPTQTASRIPTPDEVTRFAHEIRWSHRDSPGQVNVSRFRTALARELFRVSLTNGGVYVLARGQ